MSGSIQIKLTSDAERVAVALKNAPAKLLGGIANALDLANEHSKGIAEEKRLSFSRDLPTTLEGLRTVTRRLRQAGYVQKATIVGNTVTSLIGNNVQSKGGVNYAALHEFGFIGTAQISSFLRNNPAKPGPRGGKGKKGNNGRQAVSGHTRRINLPARAMYSRSINENLPDYMNQIEKAVKNSWGATS